MPTREFLYSSVSVAEHTIAAIQKASHRMAQHDFGMSEHEYNAAAIVNGRLDLLDNDYRIELVSMGRDYAHAVIEQIFINWDKEMILPADHEEGPIGDQRMFACSID